MNPLQPITDAVTAVDGASDSIIALCAGLSAYIAAHKTDPAALQALADNLTAKSAAIVAAVAANPVPGDAVKKK